MMETLVKFFMLILCTFIVSIKVSALSSLDELQKLQSSFLAKDSSILGFSQKSFFKDFNEPVEASGRAFIDRKNKTFSWSIEEPSNFSFSVKNNKVYMKMEGAVEQVFPMEGLPDRFKFVQVFFEILGFKELSKKSWKVKKVGERTFKLDTLLTKMPVSDIKILFTKTGAPKKVNFLNSAKTKFEIKFKEKKI